MSFPPICQPFSQKISDPKGESLMNQMKKTIAAILSVMLLSLGGCSTKAPENKAPETPASEQPAAETPAEETASESAAHYPFKIQSGGSELLVEKMPEKAVIFNYDIAEIMSALGLKNRPISGMSSISRYLSLSALLISASRLSMTVHQYSARSTIFIGSD